MIVPLIIIHREKGLSTLITPNRYQQWIEQKLFDNLLHRTPHTWDLCEMGDEIRDREFKYRYNEQNIHSVKMQITKWYTLWAAEPGPGREKAEAWQH